jgi:hypothetical protein
MKHQFQNSNGLARLACAVLTLLFFQFQVFGQSSFWSPCGEPKGGSSSKRYLFPKKAGYFELSFEAFKNRLSTAPEERDGKISTYGLEISLPMPDGQFQKFAIATYASMEKPLSDRFPEIRTFLGQGLDDPSAQIFLDFTPQGFHAQILSPKGSFYIDPVFLNETQYYVVYDRKDLSKTGGNPAFSCGFEDKKVEKGDLEKSGGTGNPGVQFVSGATRRIFRIAISATQEYTTFHGGTVSLGLAAVTTTLNRVNGVYNRDVTVRFNLVANNNLVIYTAEPDPFTNGNTIQMNEENQTSLDNVIGNSNYDIGHCVGTGSGGVVTGRMCNGGNKAKGSTARPAPIGDPFDIDYVAHEVGHQCNAMHTWNGTIGSCSPGQYIAAAAVEPGSGITIMAYAGICGTDDLAANSIDHFHNYSQNEIITFVQSGGGSSCGTSSATGNNLPTLSINSPTGKTIPHSTPYRLSGSGTDADADILTYCWEQNDVGPAGPPNNAARTNGPLTRSFSPAQSGERTVPSTNDLVFNTTTIGNLLGTVTRTMNYKFTVRDNRANGGGTRDGSYSFNVSSTSGPFVVTSPNSFVGVSNKKPLLVTWNVANTNVSPVSCPNVNIRLSTDGGFTFPTTLISNTPNDGSQSVTLPNVESRFCRIMVEGANNIFFDISNANFGIGTHCYDQAECAPADFGNHFIRQFSLNGFVQNSSCSTNGYESYNNTPINLVTGNTYSFAIRLATAIVNHGGAMWIDYNDDGDFDDFGERVFASTALGSADYTGTFTLPGNQLGQRRLRIRTGFNTLFSTTQSCSDIGFGETEDYWVNITGYCFDNPTCSDIDFGDHFISRVQLAGLNNPSSCSPGGYTNYGLTLPNVAVLSGQTYPFIINTSTQSTQGIGIWIDYNNDQDFNDAGEFVYQGLPNPSGIFSGNIRILSQLGIRRMRVRTAFSRTFAAGDACVAVGFGETEDYNLSISGYCWSSAPCADIDFGNHFINNFSFAGIQNNNSGCGNSGYTLYQQSTFLGQVGLGQSVGGNLSVTGGFNAGKAIWIDYNNDNDFNDAGEYVANSGTANTNAWSFSIAIPSDTNVLGIRRMRVRSVFNAVPASAQACADFGFGETEDYFIRVGVNVTIQPISQNLCTGRNLLVFYSTEGNFPNSNVFSVQISSKTGSFENQALTLGTGNQSPISISIPDTLSPGNQYKLRIISSFPKGRISTLSNLTVIKSPMVTGISPNSGPLGTTVTISGSNLGSVGTVFFGQFPGNNLIISPNGNSLTIQVPNGASSGPVFLTGSCSASGPIFTVSAACTLSISNVNPIPASQEGCSDGQLQVFLSSPVSPAARLILFPGGNLNPANSLDSIFSTSQGSGTFTGLPAGIYQVIAEGNTCRDTSSFIAVSALPCSLAISNVQTNPSSSANNGSIQYNVASPGCQALSHRLWRLSDNSFVSGVPQIMNGAFVFSNLAVGSYGLRVIRNSQNPCSDSIVVQVPSNVLPAPQINPGTGTYPNPIDVVISTTVSGASIYYTTTGNTPVVGTSFTKLYAGPVSVIQNTTIRAMVVKTGFVNSPVTAAFFTISNPGIVATPVINPGTGSYSGAQNMSITVATAGAAIYFTTNGNNPVIGTSFTRLYSGPFLINASSTIRAMATKTGLANSSVAAAFITITNPSLPAATPVISPGTGIYGSAQTVSISCATPGATIYFTTNGNVPRFDIPNSFTKTYVGPFLVNVSTSIRAIATAPGFLNSATALANLSIGVAREAVGEEEILPSEDQILVFPNPSSGQFFIKMKQDLSQEFKTFEIWNASGQKILQKEMTAGNSELEIHLENQANGLYLFKFNGAQKSVVHRVMKK